MKQQDLLHSLLMERLTEGWINRQYKSVNASNITEPTTRYIHVNITEISLSSISAYQRTNVCKFYSGYQAFSLLSEPPLRQTH
ncbi:hypothetical protein DPMN_122472 [Dreissena polymorpha]|uniref:Uncharacterized protein n=1 Tax=Dreissena polymorpha TaxID=45954 RepID=A0A9D4GRZ4_DREPO|nr:hypothetical protein DPMN_122472 [Dreissena polymorpha]